MAESADRIVAPVVVRCYSRWVRWGLGAATALLLVVSVAVFWGFAASGWNLPMAVVATFLVGVTTLASCVTAASIWNTIRVDVAAGDVVIERGPVPWRSRRVIPGETIEQLYVQQAPLGKPFWPSIGGPLDVRARLRNGRWVTIAAGCLAEKDARRVECRIERALRRRDEYGEVDDDERSEVFANWRDSLGPTPGWLDVRQHGDLVNIRYGEPLAWRLLHVLIGVAVASIAIAVLVRFPVRNLDAVLCGIVAACGIVHALGAIVRRRIIIVNSMYIARSANWPVWNWRQVSIERDLVHSLDCRSRTITWRNWHPRGSWNWRYNSIRYRRYWIVACHPVKGHFRLTDDLRTRFAALHLMNAIAQALQVSASATPWADDRDVEADQEESVAAELERGDS